MTLLKEEFAAYWALEESGIANRIDSTINGLNIPTVSGKDLALVSPGLVGDACDFDISNGEYLFSTSASFLTPTRLRNAATDALSDPITIFGWFRLRVSGGGPYTCPNASSTHQSGNRGLISKAFGPTANNDYTGSVQWASNRVAWTVYSGGTAVTITANSVNFIEGQWYLFFYDAVPDAFGAGSHSMSVEVWRPDGSKSTASGNPTGALPSATLSWFGIGVGFSGFFFDGSMDEVGIVRRVITPEERAFIHNSGNGRSFEEYVLPPEPEPEITTAFTSTRKQAIMLGGNSVATVANENEDHSLSVVYSDDFSTLSDYFITIGGVPCALYENENRRYAIGVWENDGEAIQHSRTFVYKGARFIPYIDSFGNFYFPFTEDSNGSTSVGEITPTTNWMGIPLAINDDSQLIVRKVTGEPTRSTIGTIGGIQFRFVEINNRWHLAVHPA